MADINIQAKIQRQQSEIVERQIFNKAIILKDKFDRLTNAVNQARISLDKMLDQLDQQNTDYGGLPLPGVGDLVTMASSANFTAAGLETLIFLMVDLEKNKESDKT